MWQITQLRAPSSRLNAWKLLFQKTTKSLDSKLTTTVIRSASWASLFGSQTSSQINFFSIRLLMTLGNRICRQWICSAWNTFHWQANSLEEPTSRRCHLAIKSNSAWLATEHAHLQPNMHRLRLSNSTSPTVSQVQSSKESLTTRRWRRNYRKSCIFVWTILAELPRSRCS